MSRWCNGSHRTLRRSRSRFDSWSGHSALQVYRIARQTTNLQDGVRFLGGVLKRRVTVYGPDIVALRLREGRRPLSRSERRLITRMALEPDGTAAACKAVSSGFDSHRRLFGSKIRPGQRRTPPCPLTEAVGDVCSVHGF